MKRSDSTATARAIADCRAAMQSHKWTAFDNALPNGGDSVKWVVQMTRKEETHFSYGSTQLEAWQRAVARCGDI